MSKIVLVTGGTRGIGAGIAIGLKDAGYTVVVNYNSDDSAAETFKAKTGIAVYKWDVSDFDSAERGISQVKHDLGPIDVLVNNAGTASDSRFENMSLEQWHKVQRVNIDSVFIMCKLVYSGMINKKWGRIINIGSMNGQAGQLNQVNYVASKAGMHGFTKALALEAAKHGITVNTIAPGYVDTYLISAMPDRIMQKILDASPVHRLGLEEEIAHAVKFLIDENSSWTTGSTITMNGGTHMY
ncbi:MAG: beta-ketoacyl-ACP reductase [Gammaproteobacteria bacterium]|jgi:acetoacetyl-CoA reductase|nr:beta-ketoacyl-ACP reductase [Gammaproteobacteria bacterium]|tara:strand:+ start:344 stop:1066 length:723 start_codon:yes stop_codon:yes gene_type:complete